MDCIGDDAGKWALSYVPVECKLYLYREQFGNIFQKLNALIFLSHF